MGLGRSRRVAQEPRALKLQQAAPEVPRLTESQKKSQFVGAVAGATVTQQALQFKGLNNSPVDIRVGDYKARVSVKRKSVVVSMDGRFFVIPNSEFTPARGSKIFEEFGEFADYVHGKNTKQVNTASSRTGNQ